MVLLWTLISEARELQNVFSKFLIQKKKFRLTFLECTPLNVRFSFRSDSDSIDNYNDRC